MCGAPPRPSPRGGYLREDAGVARVGMMERMGDDGMDGNDERDGIMGKIGVEIR